MKPKSYPIVTYCRMRNTLIVFLTLAFSTPVFSQNQYLQGVNQDLRELFSPLTYPDNDVMFLYERSSKMSDSTFYRNNSPDTSSMAVWNLLYEEMYYSAHDTTWMTPVADVNEYPHQFYGDTITMALMDYDFYYCVPNSLSTGDYFTFDTINNQLLDHPNPLGSPYGRSNIFAAAGMRQTSFFSDPVFRIDPNMFFTDNVNAPLYSGQQYKVRMDFDDGTGWHDFDMNQLSHYHAYYPDAGRKIIKVQLYDSKDPDQSAIKSSTSSISVIKSKDAEPADEYIEDLPGIDVGVYQSCEELNPEKEKVIVYIEGFDPLDFIPSQGTTIEENYEKMINEKYVDELRNFNYSFYVVNFDKSTLDLRINAMHVLNLLEYLKDKYKESNEQFVVMGHSMGGVIGRYLLTYMESEEYQNGDFSPLSQDLTDAHSLEYLSWLLEYGMSYEDIGAQNRNEELVGQMHNVRSLITIDSPHQGANIPMALQHSYKKLLHLLPVSPLLTSAFNILLDSKASKQLLINHIRATPSAMLPTPGGAYNIYQPHDARTTFMNQLSDMGNYPEYCKLVAYSNADMGGSNQDNFYNGDPRLSNDDIIDFEVELKARILWVPRSIGVIKFNLRTNPNGNGLVFHASSGRYVHTLNAYWFGIELQSTYLPFFQDNQYALNAKPYGTRAAGLYSVVEGNFMNALPDNSWNLSSYYLLNLASWNTSVNNGCFGLTSHIGWNGFASRNLDMDICSDGLHFGFVPLQSALDYGNGLNLPLNHDIENEGINTKLGRTPFDLMIGFTDGENHSHSDEYYDPLIYNVTGQPATACQALDPLDQKNFKYAYYDADVAEKCEVKRSLLCLEIGDEQMYLENWTLNRDATFRTQFDLLVNERNPYYEYPSTTSTPLLNLGGIYSKEEPFLINPNGFAFFITNPAASPSGQGFVYNNNFSGDWDFDEQFMNVCVEDYAEGKSYSFDADKLSPEKQVYAKLFPNPNNGEGVMLAYDFLSDEQVNVQIVDVTGKHVMALRDIKAGAREMPLDIGHLENGMYLVNVFTASERQTIRLIIH